MSQNFSIPISRRDFLKLAGITTAGAILTNSDQKVSVADNRSVSADLHEMEQNFKSKLYQSRIKKDPRSFLTEDLFHF